MCGGAGEGYVNSSGKIFFTRKEIDVNIQYKRVTESAE